MSKKEKKCTCTERVGGQAVIEGVMMRGPKHYSTAVRTPDGSITTDTHDNKSVKDNHKFLRVPIIRGVVNYIEMMILAFSTMNFAANAAGVDEEESESKFEKWLDKTFGKSLMTVITAIGSILGIALSIFLFVYLPRFLSELIFGGKGSYFVRRLVEGIIKIALFCSYLYLISLIPDIKRVFMYHGAEHKTIFCYEKQHELTVDNVKVERRFHPRCGTSFLFVMIILSILLSTIVKIENSFLYLLYKLLTLPILVGLGYEIIIYAGTHDNRFIKIITAPGLWMQRLTTREPDASMIECAIVALKSSLPEKFTEDQIFAGIKLPEKKEKTENDADAENETDSASTEKAAGEDVSENNGSENNSGPEDKLSEDKSEVKSSGPNKQ